MDLLLGSFADAHVPTFDWAQLDQYEHMLTNNDPDLYDWYAGRTPVPEAEKSPPLDLFLAYRFPNER